MKCVSKKEKVKSVSQPTPMRACYVCVILFAKTKSKQSDTKQTLTFIHSFVGYMGRDNFYLLKCQNLLLSMLNPIMTGFWKFQINMNLKKYLLQGQFGSSLGGKKQVIFIKCRIKYYQNKSLICAISIMQNNENTKRTKLAKTNWILLSHREILLYIFRNKRITNTIQYNIFFAKAL